MVDGVTGRTSDNRLSGEAKEKDTSEELELHVGTQERVMFERRTRSHLKYG